MLYHILNQKSIFSYLHVGSSLQQMLPHVISEVVEELDLLVHGGRELVHGVVVLTSIEVDVVDVVTISKEQQLGQVIEHYTDTVIVKTVAEAILVTANIEIIISQIATKNY